MSDQGTRPPARQKSVASALSKLQHTERYFQADTHIPLLHKLLKLGFFTRRTCLESVQRRTGRNGQDIVPQRRLCRVWRLSTKVNREKHSIFRKREQGTSSGESTVTQDVFALNVYPHTRSALLVRLLGFADSRDQDGTL